MNYLVDTHIFLWTIQAPKLIPKKIKPILLNPENNKYLSLITFWEISLKYSLGKIDLIGVLPDKLPSVAQETGFELLDMDKDVLSSFYKLPRTKNKDPFDRLLAWQAINSKCILLTKDKSFLDYKNYGLRIIG